MPLGSQWTLMNIQTLHQSQGELKWTQPGEQAPDVLVLLISPATSQSWSKTFVAARDFTRLMSSSKAHISESSNFVSLRLILRAQRRRRNLTQTLDKACLKTAGCIDVSKIIKSRHSDSKCLRVSVSCSGRQLWGCNSVALPPFFPTLFRTWMAPRSLRSLRSQISRRIQHLTAQKAQNDLHEPVTTREVAYIWHT